MELLVKLLKYLELIINYSSRKIVRDISILILSNIYREENKEEYILNFIFNEVKILVESWFDIWFLPKNDQSKKKKKQSFYFACQSNF